MKKVICLTLLLGFVSLAFAKRMQDKSALEAMVDTEHAFAKMSEDQGTRPASWLSLPTTEFFFVPGQSRKAVVCGTSFAAV